MNKSALVRAFLRPIIALFQSANKVNTLVTSDMPMVKTVSNARATVRFHCPNSMTLMRANTLFEKEPDTIEWINGMKQGEILYDIGANVGVYTLYAGLQGVRVFAFEPESQNYAILNKNIHLNQLSQNVTALNVALAGSNQLDYLYISNFITGGALNNFAEEVDYKKEHFDAQFKQGIIGITLDDFVSRYNAPIPDHIKIDVDGLEAMIIAGGSKTLSNPNLKTVLIELNTALEEDLALIEKLESFGFKVKQKKHSPIVTHSDFKDVYNFVFVRAEQ